MTERLIKDVAEMMAQYDRRAANAFQAKPFHRKLIAKAFLRGCKPDTPAAEVGFKAFRAADLDERCRALMA